ncbi:MAG TPA: hypothetical protein VF789_00880 [Thermoanaerobaculia bacterium]
MRSQAFRRLAPVFLLAAVTAAGAQEKSQEKPREPKAPEVELSVVPEMEGVEPGEALALHVFVSNPSAVRLEGVSLVLPSLEKIRIERSGTPLASVLPPFGSAGERLILRPENGALLGERKLPFTLRYRWRMAPLQGESAKRTVVAVEVRPPFAEEAKGLPGGSGALLALLLPVIPAFLTYQVFDELRKKQGLQMPRFSNEYIVPAFFIALIASALRFLPWRGAAGLGLGRLLVLSAVLGAIWPLLHWAVDIYRWKKWGFGSQDEMKDYLRKALLSPWSPRHFTWTVGLVGKEKWEGIMLRQPDGSLVLGSTLVISHKSKTPSADEYKAADDLIQEVNEKGLRESRERLIREIESGALQAKADKEPQMAGQDAGQAVVSGEEIEGFTRTHGKRCPLLRHSQ